MRVTQAHAQRRGIVAVQQQGDEWMKITRDELVRRVVRAGELEVSGDDPAETDTYFDTAAFRFYGPTASRRTAPGSPRSSSRSAPRSRTAPSGAESSSSTDSRSRARPGSKARSHASSPIPPLVHCRPTGTESCGISSTSSGSTSRVASSMNACVPTTAASCANSVPKDDELTTPHDPQEGSPATIGLSTRWSP